MILALADTSLRSIGLIRKRNSMLNNRYLLSKKNAIIRIQEKEQMNKQLKIN